MDMKKLLSIVSGDKKQLNESISECGEMTAPTSAPSGSPVTMSLSMNAQGIDQIKELIQLIQTTEPHTDVAPTAVGPTASSEPALITSTPNSDEVTTIKNLAGIQVEPEAKTDSDPEQEGAYDASTTPDPKTQDADFMLKDLSGGLNKQKEMHKHSYKQGDNPMAMEEINALKNKLLKEYETYKLDESSKIDEVSPHNYDSDWDYQDAVNAVSAPKRSVNPKANNDEFTDPIPSNLQKTTTPKHKQTWQRDKEGVAPNGKPYNCTVVVDAVDKYSLDAEINSLEDYHRGAKDVVDLQDAESMSPEFPVRAVLYVVDNHKYGMWKPWKDKPAIAKSLSF